MAQEALFFEACDERQLMHHLEACEDQVRLLPPSPAFPRPLPLAPPAFSRLRPPSPSCCRLLPPSPALPHPREPSLVLWTQVAARAQLDGLGLVAFVADGSILPRASGASDLPMDERAAVKFCSPPSLRVSLTVPNRGAVLGMGVPKGVTLIVGGGFHGKSTLLEALQLGVYQQVPANGAPSRARARHGTLSPGARVGGGAPSRPLPQQTLARSPAPCPQHCSLLPVPCPPVRTAHGTDPRRGPPCATLRARAQVPGDGRELVVTDGSAVKVRAEDGRSVTHVDISPFIDHLPFGKRTTSFSTADASGSTSQVCQRTHAHGVRARMSASIPPYRARMMSAGASGAASQAAAIIEALEAGASALLLDEDTSATNFMIRDARMQALVAADKEPIRPFISRVRSLWSELGVSTILVVGGSGDYFDVADTVLMLDEYSTSDATARAKELAHAIAGGAPAPSGFVMPSPPRRCPGPSGLVSGTKVHASRAAIRFGDLPELDLGGLEQLVEHSQTRATERAAHDAPVARPRRSLLCAAVRSLTPLHARACVRCRRAIAEALMHLAGGPMAGGETPVDELLASLAASMRAGGGLAAGGGLDVLRPSWRLGNRQSPLRTAPTAPRVHSVRRAPAPTQAAARCVACHRQPRDAADARGARGALAPARARGGRHQAAQAAGAESPLKAEGGSGAGTRATAARRRGAWRWAPARSQVVLRWPGGAGRAVAEELRGEQRAVADSMPHGRHGTRANREAERRSDRMRTSEAGPGWLLGRALRQGEAQNM